MSQQEQETPVPDPNSKSVTLEYWVDKWSDTYDKLSEARRDLANAYTERAQLIAFMAAVLKSSWNYGDSANPEWPVVYIDLEEHGQASWHISPADFHLFGHVPQNDDTYWDGHTTIQKYHRLQQLVAEIIAERETEK